MTKEEKVIYNKCYYRSEVGVVSCIYKTQKASSKKRCHLPPGYTKIELEVWLYKNNFKELYDDWVGSGYDKNSKPSVDRIDDSIGYSISNIQLITWGENNYKGRKTNSGLNNFMSKEIETYEDIPVLRCDFKKTCKRRGFLFSSFQETLSDISMWHFSPSGKATKRYFYKYKK